MDTSLDLALGDPVVTDAAATEQSPRRSRRHLWILRRLGIAVITLLLVSLIVFVATQALPNDPAKAILGRDATPERLAQLRADLGLNRPAIDQYTDWLDGAVVGDLGTSLAAQRPVSDLVWERFRNSAELVFLATLFILPLSFLLGVLSAVKRDGLFDTSSNVISLILNSLPEFVIGVIFVILLGTTVFTVFPSVALFPAGESPFEHPNEMVLPVATLVAVSVPYLMRLVRASMIDVLESDYVQMARLKGVSERRILLRHALPNALVPTIQGTALILAYLAGGIVVIEYLFRFPGIGGLLTEAISARDLPVIQACVLLLAAVYIVVNLVADILTVYVSPRLRTAGR